MKKDYYLPIPLVDSEEINSLDILTNKYKKLTEPSLVAKAVKKVGNTFNAMVTPKIKEIDMSLKQTISEKELYKECMRVVGEGFQTLEKNATKVTISEKEILNKINKIDTTNNLTSLEEICLVRGYNISKIVNRYRLQDLSIALVEGGATGAFGFAGLPFNIVLSTFIYYRAVQSIAMMYGYDVKHDVEELFIASNVFLNALSPSNKESSELSSFIGKIMIMTETTVVKQTAKKTWAEMAERGGICLIITQMKALANKSAQKALEKTGQKGLEKSVFKNVLEQVGRALSKKSVGRIVPGVGAIIGALFDTAQMNKVLEYADIFYNKRFILEKEVRVNQIIDSDPDEYSEND
ncbi:MAG: EcsC family protein [Lachnospiraceae bacterium]|nr:EcsC family protein [Lachnospiraceae bacterium]